MAVYKVVWVADWVYEDNSGVELANATAVMNRYAAEGWEVVTAVPGTNAQTYSGLFITFRRG